MTSIAIIDYDVGNIRSICSAFEKEGASVTLSRSEKAIFSADGLVLPGVGAYSHGMHNLKKYGLDSIIKNFAATGKPVLGICLGMQLLLSKSEEFGHTNGLDLIPGSVEKLEVLDPKKQKLPHVSWNELQKPPKTCWNQSILEGVDPQDSMYFVHSYVAIPLDARHVLSLTDYSDSYFCSSVKNGNVYGCQFHPERSGERGLKIISNFIKICGVS